MLIDLNLVAKDIKNVGLYDFILQDCLKISNKNVLIEEEIISLLQSNNEILENYKQTNIENNISNIHFRNLELERLEEHQKINANQINSNLNLLRNIEKYTLKFEESPTLVFIFSIEFFILFSVQYFIVLLGLKNWQWEIYGLFSLSVLFSWMYANKQKEKYKINNKKFKEVYLQTEQLINKI
ncbi:hypothetical protein [Arcobacter sp. s6]|uniref:hypothetical protein n=1 Tax=Arcobacter sp. s6 TaxID=3230363 RepID=UPI00349FE79F